MISSEKTYEYGQLSITVRRVQGRATIIWRGVSDTREPSSFLNPLARELKEAIGPANIVLDLSELEFMNSATVAPFIGFVRTFASSDRMVAVVFSDIDWQRPHAQCMRAIARTLQHVQIEVRAA
jgi:anti-anti-sigma regulatory factor